MTFKPSAIVASLAVAALVATFATHAGAQTARKKIGVAFYSQTIPLYVEMRRGMEAEAAKRNVDLQFQYSGPDAQQQSNQIANFVTTKVDLILCSPFDKNALINAYKAARTAGVPIISLANDISDPTAEDAFIGNDWAKFGRMEMTAAVKAIGGSGPIGIIEGPPAIGFVLSKYPNVKVVADLNGPLTIDAGLTAASNILTAHPDVKAIVNVSDELAQGTAQALKERSIGPGKIFVAGWDGYPAVIDLIKTNGGIDYTIDNQGYAWGVLAVDVAADYLAGKKPKSKSIDSPYFEVTKETVNKMPVVPH
jgi:ribose transport system substrate-binding protein